MTLKKRFPAGQLPSKFLRPSPPSRPGRRQRMVAKGVCPECPDGRVHIDTEAEVIIQGTDERELRRWKAHVAFCDRCEFSMEVKR